MLLFIFCRLFKNIANLAEPVLIGNAGINPVFGSCQQFSVISFFQIFIGLTLLSYEKPASAVTYQRKQLHHINRLRQVSVHAALPGPIDILPERVG